MPDHSATPAAVRRAAYLCNSSASRRHALVAWLASGAAGPVAADDTPGQDVPAAAAEAALDAPEPDATAALDEIVPDEVEGAPGPDEAAQDEKRAPDDSRFSGPPCKRQKDTRRSTDRLLPAIPSCIFPTSTWPLFCTPCVPCVCGTENSNATMGSPLRPVATRDRRATQNPSTCRDRRPTPSNRSRQSPGPLRHRYHSPTLGRCCLA